ncbi:hypothetical protein [Alcanivorax sediminis]|uniref:Uncharacterized protein n=1 Tax=Alcanivorax sediminis TaxID=2663008 RepID=A0A6N7LPM2_9GAMM|nr:hypothetical protein [Alcanivorax sediminis]MQX52137.1 hypothetical protein [Alcanivorax sediminis]
MYAIRNGLAALLISLMPIGQLAAQTDTDCEQAVFALHQALNRAGIKDAQANTLPGYPHLGIDRWLAYQQQQARSPAQQQHWIRLSTDKAWQDLSVMSLRLADKGEPFTPQSAHQIIATCLPVLAARTDFDALPRAEVADSYATWLRVVGLYPVTAWLATGSIDNYHDEMTARFSDPAPTPQRQFVPPTVVGFPVAPAALSDNPLKIPLPDAQQRQDLLLHYAPVVMVADSQRWNQPGRVALDENGEPLLSTREPVSYTWISWTRYRGQNLLQLNYQFWFSERPRTGVFDGYGGTLDGVIWRVTLKPDGKVLFYDSIHPCGCYHKVYPVDAELVAADMQGDKPVFYPQQVADAYAERIALLLAPDTHYVVRITSPEEHLPTDSYGFVDADALRALPQPNGQHGSLFNGKGLVPVSKRGERFYLWPMGVPSAGAMRQPGEHAIAFKGRRHFDDPGLVNILFE